MNSSAAVSLHMIVTGEESFVPGDVGNFGKTGAVGPHVAGSSFSLTVRLVDQFYNRVPNNTPTIKLMSDDAHAAVPGSQAMTNSEITFNNNFYFRPSSDTPNLGFRIYASTVSSLPQISPSTSPYIVVAATTTDRLLITVPGEVYDPGNEFASGKTGSPTPNAQAGAVYTVTVRAVDRFYNLKSTDAAVALTHTDPYAAAPSPKNLLAGATTFDLTFKTATTDPDISTGPWRITASTAGASSMLASLSPPINVDAGAAVKLMVLVPGNLPDPGSALGYRVSAATQTAGQDFTVNVKVTDAFFNRKAVVATIGLSADDPFDALEAVAPIATTDGKASFANAVLRTRNARGDGAPASSPDGWIITASTTSGVGFAIGISTAVPVKGGPPDRLVLIAPGEVLEEGNVPNLGKKVGWNPATQNAGAQFSIAVYATDNSYNIDVTTSGYVVLHSTLAAGTVNDDPYATFISSMAPLIGGTTNVWVRLYKGESQFTKLVALSTTNALSAVESSAIPVTHMGVATKIQILVPNETAAPGKPPYNAGETSGGKDSSGGIPNWIAGTWSTVTARFVDDFWNVVPSESRGLSVNSTDPNDTLANGGPDPTTFTMNGSSVVPWRFITGTASGWKIWAQSAPTLLVTTSPAINVAAVATQMQVLLPGETAAPGTPTGKTGSPSAWTAGIATTVVVNAVD
ncbi:MAG: hypothetical protein AAB262_06415, partial [Elusimicrobiota bacterium]